MARVIPQKLPASAVWKALPDNPWSNLCELVTLGKSANRIFAKNLFSQSTAALHYSSLLCQRAVNQPKRVGSKRLRTGQCALRASVNSRGISTAKRASVQSTVRTEFAATDPASAGRRLSDSKFCDLALARCAGNVPAKCKNLIIQSSSQVRGTLFS
jgi:hypothetical protein